LWRRIKFDGVSAGRSARLTNVMLTALLQHVNAANVTRVLSIRGCVLIEGPGLLSLTSSPVLASIDLRKGIDHHSVPGPMGLDEKLITGILTSMLQPLDTRSVLCEIKMRRWWSATSNDRRHQPPSSLALS